jgi:hypothetical protein
MFAWTLAQELRPLPDFFFCGLYPNIPTTKNRCTRQLKIEGNPLFLEHVQMQGMGDQLAPIDHLVSSPLFLVEKESSSPSIYS